MGRWKSKQIDQLYVIRLHLLTIAVWQTTPSILASNNNPLLSHNFWRSGKKKRFSCVVLGQHQSHPYSQSMRGTAVIRSMTRSGGFSSRLTPMAVYMGLQFPTTWASPQGCSQHGFPQSEGIQERRKEKECSGKKADFYNDTITSAITALVVTQTCLNSVEGRPPKGVNTRNHWVTFWRL